MKIRKDLIIKLLSKDSYKSSDELDRLVDKYTKLLFDELLVKRLIREKVKIDKFSKEQLNIIIIGCLEGIDISSYANNKLSPYEMISIQLKLLDRKDILSKIERGN